jgi:signal transduction histidine kinase/ActR/RegA family two-component response regulator
MGPEAGRVARLRERVADLERQLASAAGDRRRREAEALAHTTRFLTETLDIQTVGWRIVQSVCGLFDVTAAGLRLREPDGSLVLVASSGRRWPLHAARARGAAQLRLLPARGRCRTALRAPDLLATPDITLGDDVVQRLRDSRKRSLLAVPLRVRERITGVLSIVAETGRVFTDDEVTLLQTFADLAALALENSRSRAEVERRRREAEELAHVAGLVGETADLATVGERIAEAVLRLLDVDSSAVRLLQPDGSLVAVALGGRARAYAGARAVVVLGVGLIGRAAAEGHPMWTADFNSDESFETSPELRERNAAAGIVGGLAVPMRVAATVTGVLSVGISTARPFSEREIALLQSFADQAALTIANAQAREALARQAERLRILHEIDRALIAEQAPAAIAEAVVRPLRELLGVPRVIVNLFDLEAGQVEWLAAAGPRRVRLGPGVRYSIEMAGDLAALRRGEPQTIDIRALPASTDAQALLAAGLNLYMVVPMVVGSELVGSVSVCDTAGPFPPERVAIAQEVATQLGIAIAQARLHERVRQQAAELEQRVDERTRELSVATAEADHANRAKSEFLSRMSHELRTPLNAVLGFAQLLQMEPLSERQGESVGHILRAGRHLLGLINEVLDISRIEAGRLELSLEPVPLRETLDQAMHLVRPAAAAVEVTVHADAVDDALHVLADRQRLHQVLLNLLSNAIKYNRPRGTVRVVSARSAGDRLRIAVTDNGEGISGDKLARLFTPFDRLGAEASSVEGTGLGLALSKALVEAMGGVLRVESEPGTGSTFSVELMVAPSPSATADAVAPDAQVPGAVPSPARRRTILYIEDNLSNLRLVEHLLRRRPGVTVLSAMQGQVGLDLARSHRPDLILLDRHLPDIAGEEVLRLLQADARTVAIPVVILSADAIPGGIQRFLDGGARAYLTKPLDVRHLLAVVDEALPATGH